MGQKCSFVAFIFSVSRVILYQTMHSLVPLVGKPVLTLVSVNVYSTHDVVLRRVGSFNQASEIVKKDTF